MNTNIELSLLNAEEKELLNYIWNLIPAEDKQTMTQNDVLSVLDLMDDYLLEHGLLEENEQTGETTYLDGEIDENEQLEYLINALKEQGKLTSTGKSDWQQTTVSRILKNPVYYGKVCYHRSNEIVDGTHEPIVSEETFVKANQMVRERRVGK